MLAKLHVAVQLVQQFTRSLYSLTHSAIQQQEMQLKRKVDPKPVPMHIGKVHLNWGT